MKRGLLLSFLFALVMQGMVAQSRFGAEYKASIVRTENNGQLNGGGGFFGSYSITKESNQISFGYSLGLVYKINDRILVKLHFGQHRNGRILDLTSIDDTGMFNSFTGIDEPFVFTQLAPSFTLRLVNNKIILPVEVGININKTTDEGFVIEINEINFDIEISTGIQYRIIDNFIAGLQGVYTGSLKDYQNKERVWGTYKPRQYGLELSLLYEFGKNKN